MQIIHILTEYLAHIYNISNLFAIFSKIRLKFVYLKLEISPWKNVIVFLVIVDVHYGGKRHGKKRKAVYIRE